MLLFWQIGRGILERQDRESWGATVIERPAQELRNVFPNTKGFSARNLKYMRTFAETWPSEPFVQGLLAHCPGITTGVMLRQARTLEVKPLWALPLSTQWLT